MMMDFARSTQKQNAGVVSQLLRGANTLGNLFVALLYAKTIKIDALLTEAKNQNPNVKLVVRIFLVNKSNLDQFTGNLALLPKDQRDAIEEDKSRWFEANKRYTTQSHVQIRGWLERMPEGEYREDMRRRLNILRKNKNERS